MKSGFSFLFPSHHSGVAYWRAERSFAILAGFSLFSASSLLFVSPAITTLLLPRCYHLFRLEREDGVCHAWQLVLHMFAHMVAITTVPLIIGSVVIFSMVLTIDWTFSMCAMVALINMSLNATAMALVCIAYWTLCLLFYSKPPLPSMRYS